jgi:hypothetical protein
MTKINFFFDGIHNDIQNNDDYVICIFRNVRGIFDSKANTRELEYCDMVLKLRILKI